MAPFKLKFRTGSSRNTSQETDNSDQQYQQHQQQQQQQQNNSSSINYSNLSEIGASSSTIDSTADCTSIESYSNNDRKLLLSNNNGNNSRISFLNPTLSKSEDCVESSSSQLSYDQSSEENIQNNIMDGENLTLTTFDSDDNCQSDDCSMRENSQSHLSLTCTDPECKIFNDQQQQHQQQQQQQENISLAETISQNETINSTEYLISTHHQTSTINNTSSTVTNDSDDNNDNTDDNNLLECTIDNCEQFSQNCNIMESHSENLNNTNASRDNNLQRCYSNEQNEENQNEQSDNEQYQNQEQHHRHHCLQQQQQQQQQQQWNSQSSLSSDHHYDQSNDNNYYSQQEEITIPEIINNKSSKKIYKAMAKQSGISCKMSNQCRCMECQSNYFDCEFDNNDHQKTDGGLGAGTPMFISEVMHGSACIIL